MKKLLGIVVLGLLWCNVGFAKVLPDVSPNKQYEFATSFLKVGDYVTAEDAFREFVEINPNHKLAGNAQYWLAETYRIRERYLDSAHEYLIGYQKYPDSEKAPINLLRLGVMLIVIGEWDQGCLIIDGVKSQYPKAKRSVLKRAKNEFRKMCRNSNQRDKWIKDDKSENGQSVELEKPKKQEPKKEKPEVSPDDNKVVPAGSGSGFFVSMDGHVITNYHVIEGCKTTKVSFNGNQIEAKILAVDKVNDIAILKTDINPNRIFSVSNEDVSLLEDVIVAGFPLGKKVSAAIKTHKGVVTALAGEGDNYSEFQTDATINKGNSGGPVINQKGNVVGIAVALLDVSAGQNMFFAIKSSTLKQFANSNSLTFIQPNYKELNNKDLGKLITEATVYLECYMSIAKIKQMIALENNKKAFFNEFK